MGKKVLIVDDELNIVTSLEFVMKREGFEVALAMDGEAALDAMTIFAPDLVLLDIMMPKKDGFEVCQLVRANPMQQDIKVVMVTARAREADREKGLALGADAYVTKPFATKELVQLVKNLLGENT